MNFAGSISVTKPVSSWCPTQRVWLTDTKTKGVGRNRLRTNFLYKRSICLSVCKTKKKSSEILEIADRIWAPVCMNKSLDILWFFSRMWVRNVRCMHSRTFFEEFLNCFFWDLCARLKRPCPSAIMRWEITCVVLMTFWTLSSTPSSAVGVDSHFPLRTASTQELPRTKGPADTYSSTWKFPTKQSYVQNNSKDDPWLKEAEGDLPGCWIDGHVLKARTLRLRVQK